MNKVITDGLVLMPPAFGDGLGVWSREDGTPGTDTYATDPNAALVPADQDFGTTLEILKADSVTTLRYMGETPMLPGMYLRISARIKAVSGNLPDVRIGAWAGNAAHTNVAGVPQTGPSTTLTSYGEVVTVSAIVGIGDRGGVDMPWGETASYGHFGLDLTGPNGGTVRVESIRIEDVTHVFYRKLMDWVDVKDFGAVGDGSTDDHAAFQAADAAADGREVLVSEGEYRIADNLTMNSPVRFEGRLIMDDTDRLALTRNFDLDAYSDAFGDDVIGLKKGLQTLFNQSDHEAFDLVGRRVLLSEPIDVQAVVDNKTSYANRRLIRNGQISAADSSSWDDDVQSSTGTWVVSNPSELSDVADVANIEIGSLVTAPQGVGREVYVSGKNVAAGKVFLSHSLGVPPQSQTYTFRRFKYLLDFIGFQNLQRFVISNVEFLCSGRSSAVMLPINGLTLQFSDCFFTKPKDRGITSADSGCQGLQVDRCQFLSNEQAIRVQDRVTIAMNVNRNDPKIRDNRAVRFKHFAVLSGTGNIILGNHYFQGDTETDGLRSAGIILTKTNAKTTITGNYIDNNFVEWVNEHDAHPELDGEFSFGGLTINGNIFMSSGAAPWTRFIVIKPMGPDHYINGLTINDNVFKQINGQALDRVDGVDDSVATLDGSRTSEFLMQGNTFHGVQHKAQNPITVKMTENTAAQVWEQDLRDWLPFDTEARVVTSAVPEGAVRSSSNVAIYTMPYATTRHGVGQGSIRLNWSQPVKGSVQMTARCDTP
ncbi:right-handed parallel beta-helix repeat-containing protein [Rhodophyticola sp. CCM32]|uniref:glycosyl hydrolase family 28-related protein n=1 Tax=Rhodophyticola sp. CCM32 TaxID=2916397 RepID=UPI00107F5EA7|nr:glycosyl hydrolase family 28-related protein [Rhodophyticola sp. CCM32]QBY01209.1 right-handed parallel beta-helix repeat-containing protein [Rhodophyticola sp. CCM32]